MAYAVDIALQNNIERISGAILADTNLNIPNNLKYPCSICNKNCLKNQLSILCDGCEKWCHQPLWSNISSWKKQKVILALNGIVFTAR